MTEPELPSTPKKGASRFTSTPVKQSPSQQAARRITKRALDLLSPLQTPKRGRRADTWSQKELQGLVQFVAIHKTEQQNPDTEWPGMRPGDSYWEKAAAYIQEVSGAKEVRKAGAVRTKVCKLRQEYPTIDEAEESFGLSVESYIDDEPQPSASTPLKTSFSFMQELPVLTDTQLIDLLDHTCQTVPFSTLLSSLTSFASTLLISDIVSLVSELFSLVLNIDNTTILTSLLDKLVTQLYSLHSCDATDLVSVNLAAMKTLTAAGKTPDLTVKYAKCIAMKRPNSNQSLMPLNRMPFGLIQYQVEFFTADHVKQIRQPDDFSQWQATLDAEFPSRLQRLIRGPMWSGCKSSDIGIPLEAHTNIASVSKTTLNLRTKKSDYTDEPVLQTSALRQLKEANPDGRFWLKLDATDVTPALQESMKGTWNGDEDLGGDHGEKLANLRKEYDMRQDEYLTIQPNPLPSSLHLTKKVKAIVSSLKNDTIFLNDGHVSSRKQYSAQYNRKTTGEEKLKSACWNCVEYCELLQQSQQLAKEFSLAETRLCSTSCTPKVISFLRTFKDDYLLYLKNLFRKKRSAATHCLVVLVSDERRRKKPYALPLQYIPYVSIRDRYIRDVTQGVKAAMTQMELHVVGTTTDGEFCTLRTKGETGPLHVWQIIHDSKDAARKMREPVLSGMLKLHQVDFNTGQVTATTPNDVIPAQTLLDVHNFQVTHGVNFEEAVRSIRQLLVPNGYQPHPFRRNAPETFVDTLRSVVATYIFRREVSNWKENGRDFTLHLYVPEVDPTTKKEHHERGDHGHILKRIATSTREGRYAALNLDAFDAAMRDKDTGLTYAALVGQRKQSVKDAEKLLSFAVAEYMEQHNHATEAEYVRTIAAWHESSDGRGISQLQRCKANHMMLQYILDEWLPWHRDMYDFSTIDINRPVDDIRGFTRETLIEVTTNIESQELRRQQNKTVGYEEHPRASTSDDVELFFALVRRHLGGTFTLKEFKSQWRKLVREFGKRMDNQLPFYYWTLNERYTEEDYASFDVGPAECDESERHPLRLHRVEGSRREDGSIFTAGRSFLPARHRPSIRQRLYRVEVPLPPVPEELQPVQQQ